MTIEIYSIISVYKRNRHISDTIAANIKIDITHLKSSLMIYCFMLKMFVVKMLFLHSGMGHALYLLAGCRVSVRQTPQFRVLPLHIALYQHYM